MNIMPNTSPDPVIQLEVALIKENQRGWMLELTDIQTGMEISSFHLGSIRPGQVRGNHYHKHKSEQVILLSGTVLIVLESVESGKRTEKKVIVDKPRLWKINPMEVHAIKNIGQQELFFGFWEEHYGEDKTERMLVPE